MITTSTSLKLTGKQNTQQREACPEIALPSQNVLSSILNYSKNLEIKKSIFVQEIEIIKS